MKKKRGKNDKSLQKEKAWAACSRYIRVLNADKTGMVECVTCNKKKNWKEIQAGHYIQGRGNAILFELRNIHPQCMRCNVMMNGRLDDYTKFMLNKYGVDVVMELQNMKYQPKKITLADYWEMIDHFTERTKEICEKKGLVL